MSFVLATPHRAAAEVVAQMDQAAVILPDSACCGTTPPAHQARKENGMKSCKASESQTMCRILLIACATALAVAFAVALPQSAHAADVKPPPVPDNIEVPAGNTAFLEGHGVGTQNYICLPCPNPITSDPAKCPKSGFAFTLFTPQATLFNDDAQVTTHYFSPNLNPTDPGEILGTIRVTWQHSRDTSTVWGKVIQSSSDSNFVASDAIAWLLVQVVGAQDGPTGGDTLSETTFIQRVNTFRGVAPAGCDSRKDVGKQAFMPYEADYFFYKAAD